MDNPYRYEEYINTNDSLSFTEAMDIYKAMTLQLDLNNEDCRELFENYLKVAIDYAGIRARWLLMSREDRINEDIVRTARHDRSIIALNVLARFLQRDGKDATWRTLLGVGDVTWMDPSYDVKSELHRKRIGDFHCYVALIFGLNSR